MESLPVSVTRGQHSVKLVNKMIKSPERERERERAEMVYSSP